MLTKDFPWLVARTRGRKISLPSGCRAVTRLAIVRWCFTALFVLATLLAAVPALAQTVGPSFPCAPAPSDALARLTCADPTLARADIRLVQTYYALRMQIGTAGQKSLRDEMLSFQVSVRQLCGLPPVTERDQSLATLIPNMGSCIAAAYEKQRSEWSAKLSGPAAEEAARPPEQNIALQSRLKQLGFLAPDAAIDGVFGTATRSALLEWQRRNGRPVSGFFSDADAEALTGSGNAAPPDPRVALRLQPLAQTSFKGPPATISYRGLRVQMDIETSHDPAVCQAPNGGFLGFVGTPNPQQTACSAIILKLESAGNEDLALPAGLLDGQVSVDSFQVKLAIRRLDPNTLLPQVVVSAYSGGAHCCTKTTIFTKITDGSWHIVDTGEKDGDGYDYLDLQHAGYTLLVDFDGRFLYKFASYSGSYAPTRIRKLSGVELKDVTRDPRYRTFLLHQLNIMEQERARYPNGEVNGYLAAWIAQNLLIGRVEGPWRIMLNSYSHYSNSPTTTCAIERRDWPKLYGERMCPNDQRIIVPFPEALAIFLVKSGYLTPEESSGLGFDTTKILDDRRAARAIATAAYEKMQAESWFAITNGGECTRATSPSSPAQAIVQDREKGVKDTFSVLRLDNGKPAVVRVTSPMAGDLVSTITFYRGFAACDAALREKKAQLKELK
jgi:hypothetical protein